MHPGLDRKDAVQRALHSAPIHSGRYMQIAFGRLQIGVPQQFLHGARILARFQQVGSE